MKIDLKSCDPKNSASGRFYELTVVLPNGKEVVIAAPVEDESDEVRAEKTDITVDSDVVYSEHS